MSPCLRLTPFALVAILLGMSSASVASSELDACLNAQDPARVARLLDPDGRVVYALVTAERDGHIGRAATIAPDATPLIEVFERAHRGAEGADYPVSDARVCEVVDLPESEIDAETKVILSTGLNYAAHAEEAGGGEVFLFPKPSAPTPPYADVHPPAGVTLLDYEVELAFVLLEEVDPAAPPSREALLEKTAFFLSNDVSDREPIVANASLTGISSGFPEGKGQPGFFPAGPWMVRGSELFAALDVCNAEGLRLQLWVDDEPEPRQDASTAAMILSPAELVERVGSWIEEHGRRSSMPFRRPSDEAPRFYPLAVPERDPKLSVGSIVQTGTPEGVALNAPGPLGVTLRGLLRLRGPFSQFLAEEKQRVAAGGTKYLAPGSIVRARIDGLGTQRFRIGEAGARPAPHPCNAPRSS